MDALRLPASTPRVSRSPALVGLDVIAIEGAQFDDGLRRIVVGPEISDDSLVLIVKALEQLDFEDGRRRRMLELLALNHEKGGQS